MEREEREESPPSPYGREAAINAPANQED